MAETHTNETNTSPMYDADIDASGDVEMANGQQVVNGIVRNFTPSSNTGTSRGNLPIDMYLKIYPDSPPAQLLETPASPLTATPRMTLDTGTPAAPDSLAPSTPAAENGLPSGFLEPTTTPAPGVMFSASAHPLPGIEEAAAAAADALSPSATTASATMFTAGANAFSSSSTTGLAATGPSFSKAQSPAPGLGGGLSSPARGSTPVPGAATNNLPPSAIIPPRDGGVGSPTRVYINMKVTPVLLEGMKWVAKNEPEKPLKWLGEYLLRRSAEVEST